MKDSFWEEFKIPFQDEFGEEYEFVNPIVVQQHLIRDISLTAELTQQAESLIKAIAVEEVKKARKERELSGLRREILSRHYKEITKSASSEIQDAFILSRADIDGCKDKLLELEKEIEEHRKKLEGLQPRLELVQNRIKQVDKKSDRATSYLNQERLLMKLEHNNSRV